ncbi:MAG: hypothetical protein F4Z40_03650 [Chloroflexi bacterium]|nr:hypothetical protein [Chloroflexota bacterium]
MSGTTHEQKVQVIREIYQEEGIRAINGMQYTLLSQGTKEAQEQFEAAAIEAGFVMDSAAPDNGYTLLSIFGMAWRKAE